MNNVPLKKIAIFLLIVCVVAPSCGFMRGRSSFSARSQSVHAERELVGWEEDINLFSECMCYGSFYVMPVYSHSMRSKQLAQYFFGNDQFNVTGSQFGGMRGDNDLLADYFGLPTDFASSICFRPEITNAILDFNWYVGLDEWYRGLYIRVHAPLVHTRWNMQLCETVNEIGLLDYPAGYMASGVVPRNDLSRNVSEWFTGIRYGIGDITPLQFGKINGPRTKNALSEIQVAFGWNFIDTEDYHFGFNLRTSIPTGNRTTSHFLFEPIVGNGGHWEVGFGMTGHTFAWDSDDGAHSIAVYGDMNVTHLFGALQRRSFDFKKNGPGSRYILIEEIGTPVVQGLMVTDEVEAFSIPALQQYHGKLMPAINKTTLDVVTSFVMQVDAAIKVTYSYNGFSADFGYDLWARTAERLECRGGFPSNSFAIKGDAQVYGFNRDNQRFVALNATQSEATMHAGQGAGNANFLNANADNSTDMNDNPVFSSFDFGTGDSFLTLLPPASTLENIRASDQAILLTDADIDSLSAVAPAAISHTFFTHYRYAWDISAHVSPYAGVGAEVSLDGNAGKRHNALSEWAVWAKFGVSY